MLITEQNLTKVAADTIGTSKSFTTSLFGSIPTILRTIVSTVTETIAVKIKLIKNILNKKKPGGK
jgi:hypothetical protein